MLSVKAIVHIGTEKTGTTSIQKFLHLNRKKLRKAGFHFLQSAGKMNNRALPAYCISDERYDDYYFRKGIDTPQGRLEARKEFLQSFEAELDSLPSHVHTVIISSEHFHSRIKTDEEMSNVYKLFSTYFDPIHIVCYLREQGETCVSYYSTTLRTGERRPFNEFMQNCRPSNTYFNYNSMLEMWERYFGQDSLDVSVYERETFLNGDLIDDFCAKFSPELVGHLSKEFETENESLTLAGQALIRALNNAIPVDSSSAKAMKLKLRLQGIVYRGMKGRGQQLRLEDQMAIRDSFAPGNESVRQKFFPQRQELFKFKAARSEPAPSMDDNYNRVLQRMIRAARIYGFLALTAQQRLALCDTLRASAADLAAEST